MMVERRRDIATPEVVSEAQADREIEHDVDIGPGFAARRDDRRAELCQLAGVLIEPKADAQSFALPGAGDRKYNVREGGGRRQVEIGLYMEFELTQCLGAACRVGVRQQQIGAKAYQSPYAIGLCVDDRAVQIIGQDPAGCAQPERALAEAECFAQLLWIAQLVTRNVVDRHLRQMKIAAGDIDAAGQGVQDSDCPIGLCCIAVLLQPGPSVVRYWPMLPEQPRRLVDCPSLDTGVFRRDLGRHRAALRRVQLEGWATGNWPVTSRNSKPTGQCEPDRWQIIGAGGGV